MDGIVVGWGHSPFGRLDALSFEDLVAMVTREALADADVEAEEVDGVWLGNFNSGMIPDGFCSSIDTARRPGTSLHACYPL